jgi:hypothetical protein
MTTSDSNPHLPQDPLDECLKKARWPEPTGLERNRLEAQWDSLVRQRVRFRRRLMRWTLAASLMLAVGIGWMLWKPHEPDILPPPFHVTPPRIARQIPSITEPAAPAEPIVRPPTPYESVAFEAAIKHRRQARVNRQPEALLQALNQVLEQPDADVGKLCQPLMAQRSAYENLILSHLGTWTLAQQRAGLQVLSEIGGPQAIPVLDQLSRDPDFAKLAWPVALKLAPAALLGQWARTDTAPHRKQALQKLLSRQEDPPAIREILHLVAQPDSRTLAMEVIYDEPNPPVKALFAFLEQGTKEQRHTAGLVLGRIANPQITRQLLALATKQDFPPEVMVALMNSSDPRAARFLDQAKRNPQVRTAVQLACLEWELISYTSMFPQPLEIH